MAFLLSLYAAWVIYQGVVAYDGGNFEDAVIEILLALIVVVISCWMSIMNRIDKLEKEDDA